jgi:tetratricopeptide (TPR) repeat protein
VDPLLDANMLQELDDDRFRFHDLLRLHARQTSEADDTEEQRTTALLAILEWYLAAAGRADVVITPYRRRLPYPWVTRVGQLPALPDRDAALGWLERERVNLVAAGRAAFDQGHHRLAWHLADVMWPLFLYRKHYRDRLEVEQRGLAAAQRWGDAWAEAAMHRRVGRNCVIIGAHAAAERHTEAAIRLCGQVGDRIGALDARDGLALLFRDIGREREAVELLVEVLAGARELGDTRRIGRTLIHLGMLLSGLGRSAEAVPLLGEARELFSELSAVDPYNQARVDIALAAAYAGMGAWDDAERAAVAAADRMRELGSDHEQAEVLDVLGRIAEGRGDIGTAERHYHSSLRIFDSLGSTRVHAVRRRLDGLRPPPTHSQRQPG